MTQCKRCQKQTNSLVTLWLASREKNSYYPYPFGEVSGDDVGPLYYTIKICYRCHDDWMASTREWILTPDPKPKNFISRFWKYFDKRK